MNPVLVQHGVAPFLRPTRVAVGLSAGYEKRLRVWQSGRDAFGMNGSVKVNCEGRVVRCSPAPHDGSQDVAIVIDSYYLEPSRARPALKTGRSSPD